MRVAHRMVDQQVRDVVAELAFVAAGVEALEHDRIHAVLHVLRGERREDRLAGDAHVQAREIARRIEPAGQLALRHRMVGAMHHVFFARPDELHRRAGHLLGDQHGLADIVRPAAPAEAAAEHHLGHVALGDRQFGCFRRGGKCRFAVLRGRPDFAAIRRIERRGVHRLHRRVVLVGVRIDRFDGPGGTRKGRFRIADLRADEGVGGVEAFGQHRGDGGGRGLRTRPHVPFDGQRFERLVRLPVAVGDDGDTRAVDRDDLAHAGHLLDLGRIEALELAALHRAVADRRGQHARQLQVHAVDELARQLVGRVEALHALAGDLPVLDVLELHFLRRFEQGRLGGDGAVGEAASRRGVADDAVGSLAFAGRHVPALGGCGDQHLACGRTAFAHIVVRFADAAAAAGREVAPHAVARDVLARRGELGRDLRPVAFQFLGEELGEARHRALAHLRARDADDDAVVRVNDDPGIDLAHGAACLRVRRAGGNAEAEREGAGGRADEEGAAVHRSEFGHGAFLPQAFAAAWIAARTCW